MEIKYISSNGKSYNLIGEKMRATSGNFHRYAWTKNVKKTSGKERLIKFTKESVNYQLTLTLRGDLDQRKEMLNELIDCFEQDVINREPGTIYVGEYYIKCFIVSSETKISEIRNCWSECIVGIYCTDSFWRKERKCEFKKDVVKKSGENLDFPFDFPFDLTGDEKGNGNVELNHYTSCDFLLTIYGPCTNPRIVIGDNLYEVKTKLDDGEYLLVDSKEGTVVRVRTNGMKVNEFDNRATDPNSPFEKVQPGYNLVSWDGSFGFDLMLFVERSEPEW